MIQINKILKKDQRIIIVILLFFVTFAFIGELLVRFIITEYMKEHGKFVVEVFAEKKEEDLVTAERGIDYLCNNLEAIKTKNIQDENFINKFFIECNKTINETLREKNYINLIGVINGKVYSSINSKNVSVKYLKKSEWYIRAINSDGKFVYSGVYKDKNNGIEIITIAKKIRNTNDVIAVNLNVDIDPYINKTAELNPNSIFYVFDRNKKLIYCKSPKNINRIQAIDYGKRFIKSMDNTGEKVFEKFIDENKKTYDAYYTKMKDGGSAIVFMDRRTIINSIGGVEILNYILYFSFGVVFLLLFFLYSVNKKNKQILNEHKFIAALGDMYYAIYHIKDNNYNCIKTIPQFEAKLNQKGSVTEFTNYMKEVLLISDKEYKEICKNMILSKSSKDDFFYYCIELKQEFSNKYKWVNIYIIKGSEFESNEMLVCYKLIDDEKKEKKENVDIIKENYLKKTKLEENKTKFLNQISHDMRTPLNAIIGFANLSKNHKEDSRYLLDYIKKIEKSAQQLLLLINDLLEYSKLGQNKDTPNNRAFNVKELIEDIHSLFYDNAKQAGKILFTEINVKHENVIGDSHKLTKVINNLVSNSLKYSNSGDKIKISITEHEFQKVNKYQIIVEDTGIGMNKEFLDIIFEPYAREMRKMLNYKMIGSGLGMSIVKSLVFTMKGDIIVSSKENIGTKVIVTFPFEIDREANVTVSNKSQHVYNTIEEEKEYFNNMNILVAEDNELNMEIIFEMLKMRGAKVTKAINGQQALEKFQTSEENYYDCILMDMHMPIMDGCEATKKIRKQKRSDSMTVPIIAVTANAYAEDITKTFEAGMNGHISKPLDFHQLYEVLKNKRFKK